MAITQAMLDAERDKLEKCSCGRETCASRQQSGWDACLAFLREHGKLVGHTVPANTVSGAAPGPRFVRVDIPAE